MNELNATDFPFPTLPVGRILPPQVVPVAGDDKAVAAAKDFEAVLISKLMEEMSRTIPRSGLLDGPLTEQVESLFWYYLAQETSKNGGMGLWQQIYREFGAEPAEARAADGSAPRQVEEAR